MNPRRVVVTGLGAVTPLGPDMQSTWEGLCAGRSGVRALERLEREDCHSRIGAEVRDFDASRIPCRQDVRKLGRAAQLALAAALEAWRDAGLESPLAPADRGAALVGTGFGDGAETVRNALAHSRRGARGIHPLYAPRAMANAPAGHVAMEFGLRGPVFAPVSACASAAHALGLGLRLIRWGDADLVVAGGTEEISCVLSSLAFDSIRALSVRNGEPERASRPFDRERDGFVLGEGAAIAILEERERALLRGARIYAELSGFGMAADIDHITAPDPAGRGAAQAMLRALSDAGRAPDEVDHVNAHGTSTPLNDPMETRAIRAALGARAGKVTVSATKSMVGHLLGAAAALGFVATARAIQEGTLHPTINLENPDPGCDLDYVSGKARKSDVRLALVNAFGFGGPCASLALARAV
jgi:3-oxoacyl-[acyl-carrier-protein] synthase II